MERGRFTPGPKPEHLRNAAESQRRLSASLIKTIQLRTMGAIGEDQVLADLGLAAERLKVGARWLDQAAEGLDLPGARNAQYGKGE
jgi:hypothetical protein